MILKIITKVLANRIKPILPEIITDNQSAFLSGRLISDNILLAFEAFHYIKKVKKGKKKWDMGIKLDMAKAYDRIEWDFQEATMVNFGFPP